MASSSRRRRVTPFVLIALAAVAVAAAGAWFWRDLPRRRVEAMLANRLQAEVSLGRLRVEGARSFVLEDLIVRRMAGQPLLESLQVERLTVVGSLPAIRDRRFELLRLEGVVARVAPPEPGRPAPAEAGPSLQADRIVVPDGRLVIAAGGREAALGVTIEARDFGLDNLSAEIHARADRLDVAPIVALALGGGPPQPPPGRGSPQPRPGGGSPQPHDVPFDLLLEGVTADLKATRGGTTASLALASRSLEGSVGGRKVSLSGPVLAASLRPGEAGRLHLDAKPTFPFAGEIHMEADLDATTGQPVSSSLSARAVDCAELGELSGLLPRGARVEGVADLDWSQREGSQPGWSLAIRSPEIGVGIPAGARQAPPLVAARLSGLEARAAGTSFASLLQRGGPVSARVSVASGRGSAGEWSLPAEAFPLGADADGTLQLGPLRFAGFALLRSAPAGTLRAAGSVAWPSAGSASIERAPLLDLEWSWSGADPARLLAATHAAGAAVPDVVVTGRVSASGTLEGSLRTPSARAVVAIEALSLSPAPGTAHATPSWSLSEGTAELRARYGPDSSLVAVDALSGSGSITMEGTTLPFTIRARGAVPPDGTTADIHEADLSLADAGRVRLDGHVDVHSTLSALHAADPVEAPVGPPSVSRDQKKEEAASLGVRFEDVSLAKWQKILRPILGDPAPGFSIEGTGSGAATVHLAPAGDWTATGTAAVRGSGFASDDGTRALQGLDTTWNWKAMGPGGWDDVSLEASADVGGFELLWESLFADGKALSSKLELAASGSRTTSAPAWKARLHWLLPDGPDMTGEIDLPPAGPVGWRFTASVNDLSTMVRRYLRDPLGESLPFFSRIEASGRATIEASGSAAVAPITPAPSPSTADAPPRSAENTFDGRVRLDGVRLTGTEGFVEVSGLQLDLPASLRWAADGPRVFRGRDLTGSVRFESLTVGGLEIPATESALMIRGDHVELGQALRIPVLGGRVALEKVRLSDLLSAPRRMEGAVVVTGVRMEQAASAFDLPPLTGEMNAVLPSFLLTPDAFHVEGGGEMSVFGGTVTVGDISGVDILSRYPQLTFSADFQNIDLASVTNTFDFGEMSGTLNGWVRDCDLFRGAPVRFSAEVRTLRTGSRTINVKAVNNLAILGTGGGGTGVLGRGLTRFIRRFTYGALGMHLELDSDRFLLVGLEHSRGRELFLTGRPPFPIEIVNAQPGTPISFSEMLDRVRSLDLGKATTSPPPQAEEGEPAPQP